MKRINDLTLLTTLRNADELIVRNSATGETSRVTLATLFAIFGGVVESTNQILWGLEVAADTAGVTITFERAFADTNYVVFTFAQKADMEVVVTQGSVAGGDKSAAAITLYPAENDTNIGWLAIGTKVS